MKKILIVCQFFYPEQFRINDIAFEWVERGYDVTVVTGIPNYPEGEFYKGYGLFRNRKQKINGVKVYRLPLIPRGHSKLGLVLNYLSFPVSGFFWNLFTKIDADLVFMLETSPMNQCKVGVQYAKRHKVPCLLYVQDLWPENVEMITGIHSPLIIKPITRMVEKIYDGCTHIFGSSPSFVEAIRQHVKPEEWDKVHFWPQYAEEFYAPVEKKPHEGFVIMFTGNIGQAQGLEILPRVAAKLQVQGHSDISFIIVGDGRARGSLEDAIAENDVDDMFIFTGRKLPTEIPELLATADAAFISFAPDDIFAKTIPAKLQSYMACGMPILASAIGETERVIREADCGLCSPIGDEDALIANILEMKATSGARLYDMGQHAAAYNAEHFSKKTLMDQMETYLNA